jgi:hypothetical protein
VTKDVYFPHRYEEVAALVSPQVAARLDKEKSYGVWWASRHDWKVVERVKRPDGQYRDRRRRAEKPREAWIAVPVPDASIPREVAERARRNVQRNFAPPKRQPGLGGRRGRSWELAGGLAVCGAEGCGHRMIGHTVVPAKRKKAYHYYLCPKKSEGDWKTACSNRNHRATDLEAQVREFVVRMLEDPDTLREQVDQQVRAERESKPWLRDAGEAKATRERLAKLEAVADNYRDQQAEGLITIEGLREKLDGIAGERDALEARIAMLASGEERLRKLDSLPGLVDAYLRDLPELVGRERIVREYETVPEKRTEDNPLGAYSLTPESIRHLPEEELAEKRLDAEDARCARFREIYAMIGLQVSVYPSGALDISLGTRSSGSSLGSKGVMPWDESS